MAQPGGCAHNKLNTTQATQLNMIAKLIDPRQNTNTPLSSTASLLKENKRLRHGYSDKTKARHRQRTTAFANRNRQSTSPPKHSAYLPRRFRQSAEPTEYESDNKPLKLAVFTEEVPAGKSDSPAPADNTKQQHGPSNISEPMVRVDTANAGAHSYACSTTGTPKKVAE